MLSLNLRLARVLAYKMKRLQTSGILVRYWVLGTGLLQGSRDPAGYQERSQRKAPPVVGGFWGRFWACLSHPKISRGMGGGAGVGGHESSYPGGRAYVVRWTVVNRVKRES